MQGGGTTLTFLGDSRDKVKAYSNSQGHPSLSFSIHPLQKNLHHLLKFFLLGTLKIMKFIFQSMKK